MATLSVTNQSQLLSALKAAHAGDRIELAPGNYGSVSLDGTKNATRYLKYSDEVTIVSANSANKAVINKLSLTGVANLTFEKINFDYNTSTTTSVVPFVVGSSQDVVFRGNVFGGEFGATGYGLGTALKVSLGSDILVENSIMTGFRKGIEGWAVDGLTIRGNKISDISYDGVVTGHVQGLTIQGNTIAMRANPAEDEHRDGIQIYNQGTKAPSSDILIQGNKITSADTVTHGIYMGNNDAKTIGGKAEFYSDVVIRDNVVQVGQKLGIAIGQVDGLRVTGNTLIQHDALNNSTREITVPRILVEKDATDVAVTGNILHGAPLAADNDWKVVVGGGSGWTLSGNAVVKLDWEIGQGTADPWANVQGNGVADDFRFKGTSVAGGDRTDVNDDLSFAEGDKITLINYEANSFKGVWKGNTLEVSSTGDYAKIDSITDLQELAATSPKVSASVSGDTLTLHITQTGGVHDIVLEGLGQEYQSTYDPTLF